MKRFACLLALLVFVPGFVDAGDKQGEKKNILLITESKGFRHGCVARKVTVAKDADMEKIAKLPGFRVQTNKNKEGKVNHTVFYDGRIDMKGIEIKDGSKTLVKVEPCVVEKSFMQLGGKTGMYNVLCSQDSRNEISAEQLKNQDAVFFYTTGTLPLSETQKSDLVAYLRSGKGFGGSHCATDTFYGWKEYGEIIGGYFDGHPWHEKVKVIVEDKKNPATKHLGDSFEITDEIYQFKTPYSREKLRVLLRLDMDSVKNPGKRKDGDNALAWIHTFDKGRVFYTALGHRDEVWADPRFQEHLLGGLRYIFFIENADATPSAAEKK